MDPRTNPFAPGAGNPPPELAGRDAIIEEALQILGAKHVSELPVIDSTRRPIGLIDITDLIGIG